MPLYNTVPITLEPPKIPTLINGWTNVTSNNFNGARYYKDSNNFVYLEGVVSGGTGAIFTLESGYTPLNRKMFGICANNALGRIDILANGTVTFISGTNVGVTLDGIFFRI